MMIDIHKNSVKSVERVATELTLRLSWCLTPEVASYSRLKAPQVDEQRTLISVRKSSSSMN